MHSSLAQYLEALHTKRRASATLKAVHRDLTHFITRWVQTRQRTFDPVLFRHEDLHDWRLARWWDVGATLASINRCLASPRSYCQWATIAHLPAENPAINIEEVRTDPFAPRSLPTEAVDALLQVSGYLTMYQARS